MKNLRTQIVLLMAMIAIAVNAAEHKVNIVVAKDAINRVAFAAEYLQKHLTPMGFEVVTTNEARTHRNAEVQILLNTASDTTGLKKEGFTITTQYKKGRASINVCGNDGTGCIYGCTELVERIKKDGTQHLPASYSDAPEMVLRGGCIGVQKPYLLPGRQVYEYPYTPELFPWFYDKKQWIEYLDMLVDNRMNSVYLWNGHPFASLVKLADYPFAVEVDDATFEKNKEIFAFLTNEADKRGIFVIQMFYNILVSKPFADHYGIKTQDRHRAIDACDGKIRDYTYRSIKAFIENYPNVGLLVCLGEAMDTYEDDVEWMTKTILPAVKDGLKTLGRTDEPPVLLRAHDTDCKMVMEASLPLYKNLYTMNKYNGESLTTYTPQGPWGETHRALAALGSTHISNVHILANLEPWRWSSPDFIQKTVNAMHNVHHANALHLYPQANYWDWPYTADKMSDGSRQKQLDRDWMWYSAWGRYAWNCHRDRTKEIVFWNDTIADIYGTSRAAAAEIRIALEESGEIAPKLLRRFGITEGNRQSLLLGMFCSQLVNPYKYTVYPGFYESCGPDGEKLIEYVAKEHGAPLPINQNFPTNVNPKAAASKEHIGELPLQIVSEAMAHGDNAVKAIESVTCVTKNMDEFQRLHNDIHCYREFAYSFGLKVRACEHVLNYKYTGDISELEKAVPLLEEGLMHYRQLVSLTNDTYLHANSMQTSMRRIPIAGDDGKMKHWNELLPKYEEELANLKKNIAMLKNPEGAKAKVQPKALKAYVPKNLLVNGSSVIAYGSEKGAKKAKLFYDLDSLVSDYAIELENLRPLQFATQTQRNEGTVIEFTCDKPVTLLVGYFRDDQRKYAQAPKLEIDASASEYGQQEPCFISALRISGMPQVNIHPYNFDAGHHTLRLPKGMLTVMGFTTDKVIPRDAALSGNDAAIDWLFY